MRETEPGDGEGERVSAGLKSDDYMGYTDVSERRPVFAEVYRDNC